MSVESKSDSETTPTQPEQLAEGAMDTAGENSRGDSHEDEERASGESLSTLQVLSSVFAAGLGVQSSKNRERDFKQGRAGTFILAGLLFTALFIGTVYTVVSIVLSSR